MRSSSALAIILECVGAALLVGGIAASNSPTSQATAWFPGGPSNKAIALMVVGAVVIGFGLARILRRPAN